ncbi:MAG: hypothetical protein H8K03_21355 [Nitrospira sp.]
MANTVSGFFRTLAHAEQTKFELATLRKSAFSPPPMPTCLRMGSSRNLKHLLGIDPSSQPLLSEGVRRGGPVLEVQAEEHYLNAIADIFDQWGAEDTSIFTAAERVDEQQEYWSQMLADRD